MPAGQTAMGPLNLRFGPDNIGNPDLNPADAFAEGIRLADLVEDEKWVNRRFAVDFIESMPEAIHEAIRAVIRANLKRDNPVPITFAWQPGYDWELTVNDVTNTAQTAGGITVILRSRYPSDPHPLADGQAD
jgi:hypothetical protein